MSRWAPAYLERVNRGFAAVYALLERPRVARNAVVALLAIQSGLLAYSAYVHSPTLNEPGHLVAGLSYWKFGRFDVYNVNPPLVKLVAALPVMAVGYEEDWSGFYTGVGARPEFVMGEDFVAANGERSFFLFMMARWACIPFSWLGGIVCYLWARDLYGRPAGVIACAIWSFEPNILAHASLMTPDAHAASLGLAACYTFWRWLKHPTWTQTLVTGVVLGLAELAKTTFILFYPLWPVMWGVYRWRDRKSMLARDWVREAVMLAMRMLIGLYILNLGYGFEGSLKPLREFHFVSELFTSRPSSHSNEGFAFVPATSPHNRFADTWLGAMPMPFSKNYLLGIDVQQRDFEDYDRPSYFRGKWRDRGWWYYYAYGIAVKTPLPLLGLAIALLVIQLSRNCNAPVPPRRDLLVLLVPVLVILFVVSAQTGFNEHMRYILPAAPFAIIWVSGITLSFQHTPSQSYRRDNIEHVDLLAQSPRMAPKNALGIVAYLLLVWTVMSSLSIYPHSLSYFNELVGGPRNGHKHLLGSNVDWGQDLRYLKNWIEIGKHKRIWLATYGLCDPFDMGIYSSPLPAASVMQNSIGLSGRYSGSIVTARHAEQMSSHAVISINLLHGLPWPAYGGRGPRDRVDPDTLAFLQGIEATYCCGYSLALFGND